jgi:hypothetical protein
VHFLLRDVPHNIRFLRGSPAFTALAAAIIAIGMGAATAVFSLIYGVGVIKSAGPRRAMVPALEPSPKGGSREAC